MLNSIVGLLDAGIPASTNSYESIATVTVGAGGATSVIFDLTSVSGYKHLQIRSLLRNDNGGGGLSFIRAKMNADATSGNYYGHYLYGSGSSASAAPTAGATNGLICGFAANNGNTASAYATVVIDLLDYANTSKYKTTRALTGGDFNDSSGGLGLISGLWMNTNAITNIELTADLATKFIQYSSFALYGIKG